MLEFSLMRIYELTVIGETEEAVKAVAGLLKKLKVKIKKEDEPVKKILAYKIAKKSEGFYGYFEIEMDPAEVADLDKKLKLTDKVMRYLICLADR